MKGSPKKNPLFYIQPTWSFVLRKNIFADSVYLRPFYHCYRGNRTINIRHETRKTIESRRPQKLVRSLIVLSWRLARYDKRKPFQIVLCGLFTLFSFFQRSIYRTTKWPHGMKVYWAEGLIFFVHLLRANFNAINFLLLARYNGYKLKHLLAVKLFEFNHLICAYKL